MARQAPFTQHEAVLLLDAFLQTASGDVSRKDAISNCSDGLRRMAKAKGIEIDDTYRNINGITFQMEHGICVSRKNHNETSDQTFYRNG